jgi:pimeloyl-ACP methyl ester carboxylesterase
MTNCFIISSLLFIMKRLITFFLIVFSCSIALAQTYSIGHHSENPGYRDNVRNRDVWAEVYYPANTAGNDVPLASGQFPVMVFGHGFVMTWDSYSFLWNYFVPKGYICVFPRTEGSLSPNHLNFGQDLAFLSNLFPNVLNNDMTSAFYQHVTSKTAIMGHSMGGGASFLGCKRNTQVTTMVTFAAANTNPASIDSAVKVSIPTLVIAGTEDCVTPIAAHQLPMYNNTSANLKYFVELVGASHCKFSDGNSTTCNLGEGTSCIGWGPFLTVLEQQTRVLALTEPWLNYYLKEECNEWTTFTNNLATLTSSSFVNQQLSWGANIVPTAAITQNGNNLVCTGLSFTYQWNLNGSPIANANSDTYTPTVSGIYTVSTSGSNNCTVTSTPFFFAMSAIAPTIFEGKVQLFPNPANENLHLSIANLNANYVKVKIYNLLGEAVFQQTFTSKSDNFETIIEVANWHNGLYLMELQNEKGVYMTKWVKE